jgi:hypothetical protein
VVCTEILPPIQVNTTPSYWNIGDRPFGGWCIHLIPVCLYFRVLEWCLDKFLRAGIRIFFANSFSLLYLLVSNNSKDALLFVCRFLEVYSSRDVLFGKVLKPIKCCIVEGHSCTDTSNQASGVQVPGPSNLQRLVAVRWLARWSVTI